VALGGRPSMCCALACVHVFGGALAIGESLHVLPPLTDVVPVHVNAPTIWHAPHAQPLASARGLSKSCAG
jgi:hypothetical protein